MTRSQRGWIETIKASVVRRRAEEALAALQHKDPTAYSDLIEKLRVGSVRGSGDGEAPTDRGAGGEA